MILIWVRDYAEEPLGSMHELAPSLVKYDVLKLYNKPLLHTSSMWGNKRIIARKMWAIRIHHIYRTARSIATITTWSRYISDSNAGLKYRLTLRSIISLRYTFFCMVWIPCREAFYERFYANRRAGVDDTWRWSSSTASTSWSSEQLYKDSEIRLLVVGKLIGKCYMML